MDNLNNSAGPAAVLALVGLLVKTGYDAYTTRMKDAAERRKAELAADETAERRAEDGAAELRRVLNERVAQLEAEVRASRAEVAAVRVDLTVTQQLYAALQVEHAGLKRDHAALQRDYESLKEAHVGVLNELDSLKRRMGTQEHRP